MHLTTTRGFTCRNSTRYGPNRAYPAKRASYALQPIYAQGATDFHRGVTGNVGAVVRYRVFVSGRVQGVFFRDTCRQIADEHGVTGWVRNLPDGRVEAVFEGTQDDVQKLVDWTRHGPRRAAVADVWVRQEQPEGLDTFRVM
jgi:acylphosphatase